MSGPLSGIKVIDISAVISGPMACQVLGDQGADVIKVEPIGMGDITRIGGFRVGDISAMYASACSLAQPHSRARPRVVSANPGYRTSADQHSSDEQRRQNPASPKYEYKNINYYIVI